MVGIVPRTVSFKTRSMSSGRANIARLDVFDDKNGNDARERAENAARDHVDGGLGRKFFGRGGIVEKLTRMRSFWSICKFSC